MGQFREEEFSVEGRVCCLWIKEMISKTQIHREEKALSRLSQKKTSSYTRDLVTKSLPGKL